MNHIGTARKNMLAGNIFWSPDRELGALQDKARELMLAYNATPPGDMEQLFTTARKLFGKLGPYSLVKPPVTVEYGIHIELGSNTFVNMNCLFLDSARVVLGDRVWVGPGVQFLTVGHPLKIEDRTKNFPEDPAFPYRYAAYAEPIVVEQDCWIGGGAILLPGVTIGKGSVVGAGSVVTKDIPAGVVAVGNPCRVVRRIRD